MNSALSPREIQSLIRSGSTLEQVATQAGVEQSEIEGFAGPVLAEREFIASSAQTSTIRLRGESGSHRRLGELVRVRLRQRGIDADDIEWDAWRQQDLRWRVVANLEDEAGTRSAEFVFDARGRFSVADNADARWMIGEASVDATDEDENTIDFNDELALVRATSERVEPIEDQPGDDIPEPDAMQDDFEDTSELDELYDMLSGVSEDSVRIYTGFEESIIVIDNPEAHGTAVVEQTPLIDADPDPIDEEPPHVEEVDELEEAEQLDEPFEGADSDLADAPSPEPEDEDRDEEDEVEEQVEEPVEPVNESTPTAETEPTAEPVQDSLVEDDSVEEQPKPKPQPRKRRQRASVPSWDEIMFGGPTPTKKR